MRRLAKASSAGSNSSRGSRPGRIFRGAFATRGASSDAKGSSAPTGGRRLLLGTAAAVALTLVLGVALAAAVAPVVSVENAANVEYTTAKVKGEVNPEGQYTEWRFQYATQADFSDAVDGLSGSLETTAEEVKGQLGGLTPDTTYHLRLVAENADGQSEAVAASTFVTDEVAKPTATIETVTALTATSAHFAGHVSPNAPGGAPPEDPGFDTRWDFQCTPGCGGLAGDTIPGDDQSHAVANDAVLQPNTPYTVKLVATNAGGENAVLAEQSFKTLAAAPIVTEPGNTPLGQGEVGIGAYVTPRNAAITDCHFDFGPDESYGQSAPCASTPPTNNSPDLVTAQLSGLTPGATYHYRLSVTSETGTAESDDGIFTVLDAPSQGSCANAGALGTRQLPNCRAWEMVSPPEKNGGEAIGVQGRTRAAADGSALEFQSLAGFAGVKGSTVSIEYIAERSSASNPGSNGWTSHGITPPMNNFPLSAAFAFIEPGYKADFSTDLNRGIFFSYGALGDEPSIAGTLNLYVRDDLRTPGAGNYEALSACPLCEEPGGTPLPTLPKNFTINLYMRPTIAGASPDLGHIAFETRLPLTADTPPQPGACGFEDFSAFFFCRRYLYEWDHGTLRLAGILPDGTPADNAQVGERFSAGSNLHLHTVSDGSDGHSRIFFIQPTDVEGHSADEVAEFEQPSINLDEAGKLFVREDHSTTTQLNVSERQVEAPDDFAQALYQDASSDGKRVFFTTKQALTDDAPKGTGVKLYMYDTTKPASDPHNLTLISRDSEPAQSANVSGMIGASADGHYVYFAIGNGQLLKGRPNTNGAFYLWHDGSLTEVGSVRDIANPSENRIGQWASRQARVTPDGRHLLLSAIDGDTLLSAKGGTDYDHGKCPGQGRCRELYLYSADTNSLQCVSCNPSGGPPPTVSADDEASVFFARANGGGALPSSHQGQALSDDGRYTFFHSVERLVAADTDGKVDAYVYDTRSGEPKLLSSGESDTDSYFLDASTDGKNAFFLTQEPLSRWDIDGAYDVYDARVDGGFPEPPPPPPSCQGDACQPPPLALNDPTPSSSTFSGPGNQHAAKKQKKRAKNKHRAKKHHKRNAKHNRGASR